MLEEAILVAKAEDMGAAPPREALSPVITVDAPILIPEDYVPDLPLRMALYRRLNDAQDRPALDAFAAEMIDRSGPLPPATANPLRTEEPRVGKEPCRTFSSRWSPLTPQNKTPNNTTP